MLERCDLHVSLKPGCCHLDVLCYTGGTLRGIDCLHKSRDSHVTSVQESSLFTDRGASAI